MCEFVRRALTALTIIRRRKMSASALVTVSSMLHLYRYVQLYVSMKMCIGCVYRLNRSTEKRVECVPAAELVPLEAGRWTSPMPTLLSVSPS